mgnify:CR=1 FL=1
MKTQTAQLNYLRIAPRKVRLVADLIRGLSVNDAEAQLLVQRRRPAQAILKLLRSAVANARTTKQLNPEVLRVSEIRVDGGPMLKRSLPRARGMATPIHKKTSHVTLTLMETDKPATPRFKIVIQKKVKAPKEEKASQKEKSPKEISRQTERSRQPGFFRRIFTRKTGGGA